MPNMDDLDKLYGIKQPTYIKELGDKKLSTYNEIEAKAREERKKEIAERHFIDGLMCAFQLITEGYQGIDLLRQTNYRAKDLIKSQKSSGYKSDIVMPILVELAKEQKNSRKTEYESLVKLKEEKNIGKDIKNA